MRHVTLPGTTIQVSRFIFGTASLFNAGNAAKRSRLLDAAVDHGFTHFDTAPYYGFGVAERDLGLLRSRHSNITVTTKVGIYSPGGERQSATLVAARKAVGRLFPAVSRPTIDWSVKRARAALEASLRRLGRTHVDLYLLHEPDYTLLDSDEWMRWLETEITAGRVRQFGIAADTEHLSTFLSLSGSPFLRLVQTTDSLASCEANALIRKGYPLQITYGYVSSALREHGSADAAAILSQALKRNNDGAIIVSTRNPRRVPLYAGIEGCHP